MQRGTVVDLVTFAEFVRSQRCTGGVLRDELWAGLHTVHFAVIHEGQRDWSVHRLGGELHARGTHVEDRGAGASPPISIMIQSTAEWVH